jgi:regulatory protein
VSDLDRCYLSALRILSYRFNSEGELRRKLRSKEFERDVIDQTVARLKTEKWIDDDRFAAAYVRTRLLKHIGKLRIRRELIAAGVDDDVAGRAIRENAGDEEEALRAVCDKRVAYLVRRHGAEYLGTPEARNKLTGYLLKQGYDAALIRSVLKEIRVAHD